MKTKQLWKCLCLAFLLTSCGNVENSSSQGGNPSLPPSTNPSTPVVTPSPSPTIPEIVSFDAPKNVKIENGILSFDAVEGATAGYKVRYYVEGNEDNKQTMDIMENRLDLSSLKDSMGRGNNHFSIRVNATEEKEMSPYSNEVIYLFGVHVEKIEELIGLLADLETVNEQNASTLLQAKELYLSLDEVDRLDSRVEEQAKILATKEGEYFTLLVEKIPFTNLDEENEEFQTTKEAALSFYQEMLDQTKAEQGLSIAVSYHFETKVYPTNEGNLLTISSYCENVLNQKVEEVKPVVKESEQSLEVFGEHGFYYTYFTKDVVVNYLTFSKPISFVEAMEGGVTSFSKKVFDDVHIKGPQFWEISKEGEGEIEVSIYEKDGVGMENGRPYILKEPLASTMISTSFVSIKDVEEALWKANVNVSEVSLGFRLKNGDAYSPLAFFEEGMNLLVTPREKKLSSMSEFVSEPVQILEDGKIDYKWEILTWNSEFHMGIVKGLRFDIYQEEQPDVVVASILQENAGFIEAEQVTAALKNAGQFGSISYRMRCYLEANESFGYQNSDVVEVLNAHVYETDARLATYMSQGISVDGSGRLVWPWELFTQNPEKEEVDVLRVYVFSGETETASEEAALATFDIDFEAGDRFTYKEDVEQKLSFAGLSSGSYRFSAKLIAKEGSTFEDSAFYPLTGAYQYEVADASQTNFVKYAKISASSGEVGPLQDENEGTRWIQNAEEGDTSWILIDFGKEMDLATLKIVWETAYAKSYDVYWTKEAPNLNDFSTLLEEDKILSINEERPNVGGKVTDEWNVPTNSGRYLLLHMSEKGTVYPYSIYEIYAWRR